MSKPRSESEVTAEMSDEDKELFGVPVFHYQINLQHKEVVDRYLFCAKQLIKFANNQGKCEFIVNPIVIATDVDPRVLETLPSLVNNYKIRSYVHNNTLFISSLSSDTPHANAINAMSKQANAWADQVANGMAYGVHSDAVMVGPDGRGSAPDVALFVHRGMMLNPDDLGRITIVEVEVNHRTIEQTRQEFIAYFLNEPMVQSVIVINLYGNTVYPALRVYAVQWSRGEHGLEVTQAFDCGILPISPQALTNFAVDLPDSLPPVAPGAWQRREPVTAAMLTPLDLPIHPPLHFLRSCHAYLRSPMFPYSTLYAAQQVPFFRVSGSVLRRAVEHNHAIHGFPAVFPDLIMYLAPLIKVVSYNADALQPLPLVPDV